MADDTSSSVANRLLRVARETMAEVRYCFATTVGDAGEANTRIVEPFAVGADWTVAFVTSAGSRKAAEIRRTGRLTLGYQHDAQGAYVALVGRAWVDDDPAAKHEFWADDLAAWFPAGRADPNAVVVRFRAERVELWSFARAVMPEPRGLRAAVVARGTGDTWGVVAG